MKNSFLDIVNTYNTNKQAKCTYKETTGQYYIFVANHWFFKEYLRDIERLKNENRILVYINGIVISPDDYEIKELGDGINLNFIKQQFPYVLNNDDKIYLSADVQYRG